MKYAVLAVAGAIGMGLGVIAAAMDRHSGGHFYAPVSFLVMAAGTAMVVRGALQELKEEKDRKGAPGSDGASSGGSDIPQ